MLDVLTRVLGLILRGAEDLEDRYNRVARAQFAQELLTVYIGTVRVIETGEEIVYSLEELVADYADPHRHDRGIGRFVSHIRAGCDEQAKNFAQLDKPLLAITLPLRVFDPEAAHRLGEVFDGKRSLISELAAVLDSGFVVLGRVPMDDVLPAPAGWPPKRNGPGVLSNHLADWGISLEGPFDQERDRAVVEAVADSKIKDQLDDLREVAERMRSLLIARFTTEELLRSTRRVET
jgi:hypothetical protein